MSSKLEQKLYLQCVGMHHSCGWPLPERQFRPIPDRRFKADFCWPDAPFRLIVEVQGAIFSRGRHTRGLGYQADCQRMNLLVAHGFKVLYVTGPMIKSGEAITAIERVLCEN